MNEIPLSKDRFFRGSSFGLPSLQKVMNFIFAFFSACRSDRTSIGTAATSRWVSSVQKCPPRSDANGVVGAISFGEKGDRDRGEILLKIPARNLKNFDFFYSGYPNGTTLRYEVRALGRKPIVLNLMPASESWLELSLRVPEGWSIDDDLSIVAIDENEQFTGWVGLAVAPRSGLFAKVFNFS